MRSLVILTTTLLITGCAGYTSLESAYHPVQTNNTATSNDQEMLLQVYQRYQGTPYRYGGTNSTGFDCSGFIQTAFNEAYGISTPRTTEQLSRYGTPIRRDQLRVGDVLIFRTSIKQLHAGIYIGNDRFIHASTSQGVTQSKLGNTYWLQRYIQARRYI